MKNHNFRAACVCVCVCLYYGGDQISQIAFYETVFFVVVFVGVFFFLALMLRSDLDFHTDNVWLVWCALRSVSLASGFGLHFSGTRY